jgi:hypothetical protein
MDLRKIRFGVDEKVANYSLMSWSILLVPKYVYCLCICMKFDKTFNKILTYW